MHFGRDVALKNFEFRSILKKKSPRPLPGEEGKEGKRVKKKDQWYTFI